MTLEIVFAAIGLQPETWLNMNMSWVLDPSRGYCAVTDTDWTSWTGRVVRVPEQDRCDIGRINNLGLRTSGADIIVKGDVDIAYSFALLDYLQRTVRPGTGVCAKCTHVDLWRIPWMARTGSEATWTPAKARQQGRGACFAMHRDDWHRLRGYDERLRGWGYDDDDIYRRASSEIDIIQTSEHECWHATHPPRISEKFPDLGRQNKALVASEGPWHETPESKNWGLSTAPQSNGERNA